MPVPPLSLFGGGFFGGVADLLTDLLDTGLAATFGVALGGGAKFCIDAVVRFCGRDAAPLADALGGGATELLVGRWEEPAEVPARREDTVALALDGAREPLPEVLEELPWARELEPDEGLAFVVVGTAAVAAEVAAAAAALCRSAASKSCKGHISVRPLDQEAATEACTDCM